MKRWALVKMGDFDNDGGRVPKLNLYNCNSNVWDKPGNDWALARFSFASQNMGQIQTDPDILLLPDITADAALSSMATGARNVLMAQIEALGYTVPSNASATTMRMFVQGTLDQIQPGLNAEAFEVANIV